MLGLPPRISEWLLLLVQSQRSVAYFVVDDDQALVSVGGDLPHYGLTNLRPHHSASEQVPFLEGMLPLPETPFLLRQVGMPSGRVADVHLFTEEGATWVVFLDVTQEHDDAQKIQQKAYDMTLLSQREARLMAKLEAAHKELKVAHHELTESREALLVTHKRLQRELRDAARYVRAILPAPMVEPFAVDWLYVPSTELGGDSFGYHWIDSEHFAVYLLDVSGHGVGAALLSVAVTNTLRFGALLQTDFRLPEEVLASLNQAYQMDHHNGMYFTIWYGVYHRSTGRLRYASAGHPPPILVTGPREDPGEARPLPATGLILGMLPGTQYESDEITLTTPSRLFVFSDGAYEIHRPDDTVVPFTEFQDVLTRAVPDGESDLEEILRFAQTTRGGALLEDDFSILKMTI